MKKITLSLLAITLVVLAGCNGCSWFWNQEPACPEGWDPVAKGCKGMPPMPGPTMASAPSASASAAPSSSASAAPSASASVAPSASTKPAVSASASASAVKK